MEELPEPLGYDSERTFQFFGDQLKSALDYKMIGLATLEELKLATSILAHFAQVPSVEEVDDNLFQRPHADLKEFFDRYMMNPVLINPKNLESAGSEVLFLSGFFGDQLMRRHQINWFKELGKEFYRRASVGLENSNLKHSRVLFLMSKNFNPWTEMYGRVNKNLRDLPYLIRKPTPPPSS